MHLGSDPDRLRLPGPRQRNLSSLGGPVSAKEFLTRLCIVKKERASVAVQQRSHVGDERGCRGEVHGDGFAHVLGVNMVRRSEGGCVNGGMRPKVEAAPAIMYTAAQGRHGLRGSNVHRCQCRLTA